MCSTAFLPLRGVARNPLKVQRLAMLCLARRSAIAPKATALMAALTSRGCPASVCRDSCSSRKAMAGDTGGGVAQGLGLHDAGSQDDAVVHCALRITIDQRSPAAA